MREDTTHRITALLGIGEYVSVNSLISRLNCTESELRDALSSMRAQGFEIEENPELGIRLLGELDEITEGAIAKGLRTRLLGKPIRCHQSVDSTNERTKVLGRQGAEEGLVIIAEEQVGGKGRFSRNWQSPKGEGIWMSVLLRPGPNLESYTPLSLAAAYSVATALRDVTGVRAEVKWPNDVRIGAKKVCGILAEVDKDSNGASFIVIGIGVNVMQASFDDELSSVATSLRIETGRAWSRLTLVRRILENLEDVYVRAMELGFSDVLKDVRRLLTLIGEHVSVNLGSEQVRGYVQDIDDGGRLIVRTDDGKVREILAGEADTVR